MSSPKTQSWAVCVYEVRVAPMDAAEGELAERIQALERVIDTLGETEVLMGGGRTVAEASRHT